MVTVFNLYLACHSTVIALKVIKTKQTVLIPSQLTLTAMVVCFMAKNNKAQRYDIQCYITRAKFNEILSTSSEVTEKEQNNKIKCTIKNYNKL
jgi:hypothetical protein